MIVASLSSISRYRGISKNLDIAFDWLEEGAWRQLSAGKYQIRGDEVFALVQEYVTKEHSACRFEAHRRYIDIQMLISGKETIEVVPVDSLSVIEPYKPDIEFFACPEAWGAHALAMTAGQCVILFPEDAHRPCMNVGGVAEPVRKLVVKVAL
jgi:YhcH/YjgK/YiaL family protein